MIAPMEKVTVFIYHKAREVFLMRLQELGLLHVELRSAEVSEERLRNVRDRIERCGRFLKRAAARAVAAPEKGEEGIFGSVEREEAIHQEIGHLDARIEKAQARLEGLAPWGDLDVSLPPRLKEAGVTMRFFVATARKFAEADMAPLPHAVISRDRTYVHFVVFDTDGGTPIDADEFFYPEEGRARLFRDLEALRAERQSRLKELDGFYRQAADVAGYRNFLISRFAFLNVRDHLAAAASETVYVLRGWVPTDKKEAVASFLGKEEVYAFFEAPAPGERPPILLRNNRFARLFEPIAKMFDLPNYAELDLTALFAPFFTLFVGLCVGDAGYGLVLFLAATFLRRRAKTEGKSLFVLIQILAVSTFVWGLLTGTFFGFDTSSVTGLKNLVVFDQNALFGLALVLGLIQVLFGMGVRSAKICRQQGVAAALAPVGWILLVLGLVALTRTRLGWVGVWAGAAFVLFFNDMRARLPLRLGKGLWELYGVTGVFGDVLSYIRLFALGISSAILGLVINDSARQMLGIPYAGWVLAPVFFIAFHGLNIALSGLSSFVHPLRLTFVEFYKNAGFEGGGKAFAPFARTQKGRTASPSAGI
ncbi:MAG: V-type ATP synthase subunit I [Deltaproteobacteria bacterium]